MNLFYIYECIFSLSNRNASVLTLWYGINRIQFGYKTNQKLFNWTHSSIWFENKQTVYSACKQKRNKYKYIFFGIMKIEKVMVEMHAITLLTATVIWQERRGGI